MTAPVDVEPLARAARRSQLGQLLAALSERGSRAWAGSFTFAACRGVAAGFLAQPVPARLRLVGILVAAFVATQMATLAWTPPALAPGMPRLVWLAVGLGAALLIVAPGALQRAWRAKRGAPYSSPA